MSTKNQNEPGREPLGTDGHASRDQQDSLKEHIAEQKKGSVRRQTEASQKQQSAGKIDQQKIKNGNEQKKGERKLDDLF